MGNNLLALDQSSNITGWAFFKDNKLLKYGKFKAEGQDLGERLMNIRDKVKILIEEYDINEVIFEDIQLQDNVGNNVKTFKILAEVFGVIYELLSEMRIPNSTVLAATWKATLGIGGRNRPEQKQNAKLYVLQSERVEATQDECDAICIGKYVIEKKQQNINDWSD